MKLKHLWLKNFCQHEDRQVDLSSGLMGILGPNGSGKSNLINGIIYAITGTLPNNLAQYIKQGSDGGSFAQLTFVSDLTGMTYIIKRSLQPRRAELTCVETNQTIRKSKDIDAFLMDTLKIDFNIIRNVLTVSQEDFVSFFRSTPSVRAEILTRLFGFLELKTARESLRQILVSTKDSSENGAKLKAYRELLAEAERSLEPYEDIDSSQAIQDDIYENNQQLEGAKELLNIYKTIEYFVNQKCQTVQKMDKVKDQLKNLGEVPDVARMEAQLKELRATINYQDNAVQLADSIMALARETFYIQQKYLVAYHEFQKADKPRETDEEFEVLTRNWHVCEAQVHDLDKYADTGCCPTCGQPFPDLAKKLEEATEQFNAIDKHYDESRLIRNYYQLKEKEYKELKQRYKDKYDSLKTQVSSWVYNDSAKAISETMKQLPEITQSLQEWHIQLYTQIAELVKVFRANQEYLAQFEKETEPAKQQKALQDQLNFTLKMLQTQWDELVANAPELPPEARSQEQIKADIEKFKKGIEELKAQFHDAVRAEQIKDQIRDLQLNIDKLESLVKHDEEKLKYREVVSEVCETLATDAFPKYVMIGLLEMLTSQINYYLTTFAAPFTVMIDNSSTELYCVFNNGETFMASELSGGQKMVLAISWRLALHNTFATEESCGFLTLDEPTNHLDENNIQNLTQVMAQVKEAARDRNLQVLVITHEKALEPLFDAVIRL